jgi:effector-binding domain-containing protein
MPALGHKKWKYDMHPSMLMLRSVITGMKTKTGRSLEEWLRFVNSKGPTSEKERRAWLKTEHGLGTNYAAWIAARSAGKEDDGENPEQYLQHAQDYVDRMFAGPKEHLHEIYDEILTYAKTLGKDIRVSPCRTIVPIYRSHVIAQVKPTTRTRLDLGLALKDTKAPKRLIDTGGFAKKDRITHRIEISKPADFDQEARRWLRVAYEMDE